MKKKYNWWNHVLNFIAVILGVYLAFYVNERAKLSEDREERTLLLKAMINDLAADIKTYQNYQIPVNEQYAAQIDSLLLALSATMPSVNSHALAAIFQVENYVPNTSTYNSIKSSGKIRLIEDLQLQKQLSDYYDGLVLECVSKNEIQVDYFMGEVVKWLTQNADLMDMQVSTESDWVVLRNTLLIYQSLVAQKVKNYAEIVEESRQLQNKLDSLVQK